MKIFQPQKSKHYVSSTMLDAFHTNVDSGVINKENDLKLREKIAIALKQLLISKPNLLDYYVKEDIIGEGRFGTVHRGRSKRNNGEYVAIKSISKLNRANELLFTERNLPTNLSGMQHLDANGSGGDDDSSGSRSPSSSSALSSSSAYISSSPSSQLQMQKILLEYDILLDVKGKSDKLLQVKDYYESLLNFHIVTEYLAHGDLFDYVTSDHVDAQNPPNDTSSSATTSTTTSAAVVVKDKQNKKYKDEKERIAAFVKNERRRANIIKSAVEAVQDLHKLGIVHLDLKVEAFMFSDVEKKKLKLVDFGSARRLPLFGVGSLDGALVGSPSYASPEVLKTSTYSDKSDSWSLGVIAYIVLFGAMPFPQFGVDNLKNISDYYKLVNELFDEEDDIPPPNLIEAPTPISSSSIEEYPSSPQQNSTGIGSEGWNLVSPTARSFLHSILRVDPRERLSVASMLKHPFLNP